MSLDSFEPFGNPSGGENRQFNEATGGIIVGPSEATRGVIVGPSRSETSSDVWVPPMDAATSGDDLIVQMRLPGVKREDIDVSFQPGTLRISGARSEEEAASDIPEQRYGQFAGRIVLPRVLDEQQIKARFQNGILNLLIKGAAASGFGMFGGESGSIVGISGGGFGPYSPMPGVDPVGPTTFKCPNLNPPDNVSIRVTEVRGPVWCNVCGSEMVQV
jgi:HSP20 family molecular chaperone IbpA